MNSRTILSAVAVAAALLALGAICTPAVSAVPADGGGPCIIPWPKSLDLGEGNLTLTDKSRIVADGDALAGLAKILSDEIYQTTGVRLAAATGKGGMGDIALAIDSSLKKGIAPADVNTPKGEVHVVEITKDRVRVRGANYAAVAMGTTTVLQAVTPQGATFSLPVMTVNDQPQSEYTGTMVDVARRYNSLDHLRQVVILCRLYKIRYLHLHLSDDPAWLFPCKSFPQMGKGSGFNGVDRGPAPYDLNELLAFVKFADDRGVTIVPEIEASGHSYGIQGGMEHIFGMKDPKTGKYHSISGMINMANEAEIYPALEKIIGDLADVFRSSPYIHLGGDEMYWPNWENSDEGKAYLAAKKMGTGELYAYYINKLDAMIKKHGKKTIIWEGFWLGSKLDRDVVVMAWGGGHQALINAGFKIINVPWWPQAGSSMRKNYEWNMWRVGQEYGAPTQMNRTPSVIGAQMVLWECPGREIVRKLRNKSTPRNEMTYNPDNGRTFADFSRRFKSTDAILEKLILPVQVKADGLTQLEGAPIQDMEQFIHERGGFTLYDDHVTLTLTSIAPPPDQVIHYTLDNTEPTLESPVYKEPIRIAPRNPKAHEETWLRARAYVGAEPVGYTRQTRFENNPNKDLPRCVKVTLYEAPKDAKAVPDVAPLTPIYSGSQPSMKLHELPSFFLPNFGWSPYVMVCEATWYVDQPGKYELQYEAGAVGELFIDGKLMIDRAKADKGTVELTAGAHPIRLTFLGRGGATIYIWDAQKNRHEMGPQDLQPKPARREAPK